MDEKSSVNLNYHEIQSKSTSKFWIESEIWHEAKSQESRSCAKEP